MIIGFTGKMGTGKSTAVQEIQRLHGQENVKLNKFAGVLYEIQEYIYDKISPTYSRPKDFVKDRKLLQWIGTEWGRNSISPTLWVDLWRARTLEATRQGLLVVCDDVRFDNEAELIKSLGGAVIHTTGPNRGVDPGIQNHASESGVSQGLVDFVLFNDDDLRSFKTAVSQLYSQLNERKSA